MRYDQALVVLHVPWLRYAKEATSGLSGARIRRVVGVMLCLAGCEARVMSRRTVSTGGQQKRRRGAGKERKRRRKMDGEGEREKERVPFGVGLEGIVLRETDSCYHILVRRELGKKKKKKEKKEERVVRVPKNGTTLRFKISTDKIDEIDGEDCWWDVTR